MKKKILLLSIIIFPSLIYFFFELTQANFKKMPYFGPKTVNEKGDTVYWSVQQNKFLTCSITNTVTAAGIGWNCDPVIIDTASFPVFGIVFLNSKLHDQGYKLNGLIDYIKYKPKDISQVPIVIVSEKPQYTNEIFAAKTDVKKHSTPIRGEFDSIPFKLSNFIPVRLPVLNRDSFLNATYFKQKPVHVFDYFMVLVDKKRHIRGYYDPSYNAEVKRMIDEYKHLKIRDEYAETLKQNDIKQNEK